MDDEGEMVAVGEGAGVEGLGVEGGEPCGDDGGLAFSGDAVVWTCTCVCADLVCCSCSWWCRAASCLLGMNERFTEAIS